MIHYPKNYEEAKIIVRNSANDDLTRSKVRKDVLRATFATAMYMGVAAAAGLITQSPIVASVGAILATIPAYKAFKPIYNFNKVRKYVASGEIFNHEPEDKIIRLANEYTTMYNDYEINKRQR